MECRDQRAEIGRDDERMQQDLPGDKPDGRQKRPALTVGQHHQQRYGRKQKDGVETEDQRHRRGRLRAERRERQSRPHVTDVAVAAAETGHRGFAHRELCDELRAEHRQEERARGRQRSGDHERRIVQLLERRLCKRSKEQRWQRHVEQEKIHPLQAGFRQPLILPARIADEDQPEIRKGKIQNIDHWDTLIMPRGSREPTAAQRRPSPARFMA